MIWYWHLTEFSTLVKSRRWFALNSWNLSNNTIQCSSRPTPTKTLLLQVHFFLLKYGVNHQQFFLALYRHRQSLLTLYKWTLHLCQCRNINGLFIISFLAHFPPPRRPSCTDLSWRFSRGSPGSQMPLRMRRVTLMLCLLSARSGTQWYLAIGCVYSTTNYLPTTRAKYCYQERQLDFSGIPLFFSGGGKINSNWTPKSGILWRDYSDSAAQKIPKKSSSFVEKALNPSWVPHIFPSRSSQCTFNAQYRLSCSIKVNPRPLESVLA